jgi:hypothetical protein
MPASDLPPRGEAGAPLSPPGGSIRAEFVSAAVWLLVLIGGVALVGLLTADPAPPAAPSSKAQP